MLMIARAVINAHSLHITSAVFSNCGLSAIFFLRPGRGGDPKFLVSGSGQIFKNFPAQNCALWSSLTVIHDQTAQNSFKSSLRFWCPLARSAAHP